MTNFYLTRGWMTLLLFALSAAPTFSATTVIDEEFPDPAVTSPYTIALGAAPANWFQSIRSGTPIVTLEPGGTFKIAMTPTAVTTAFYETIAIFNPTVSGITVTVQTSIARFTGAATNFTIVGTTTGVTVANIGWSLQPTGQFRVSAQVDGVGDIPGCNATFSRCGVNLPVLLTQRDGSAYAGGPVEVTFTLNSPGIRLTTNTGYDSGVLAYSLLNSSLDFGDLVTGSRLRLGTLGFSGTGYSESQFDRAQLFTATGVDATTVSSVVNQSTPVTYTTLTVADHGTINQTYATTTVLQTLTVDAGGLYRLLGGTLDVDTLVINGDFLWETGGTLTARQIILNPGGKIINFSGKAVPGHSPGLMEITGDYEQQSEGSMLIELAGLHPASEHDQVRVGGTATLHGTLDVKYLYGFTPVLGASFDILRADVVAGTFDTVLLPTLPAGLAWNLQYILNPAGTDIVRLSVQLPDADSDGVLDVSDNCVSVPNPDQADLDGDDAGDACDTDDDNDGVLDNTDNCQFTANPGQADSDLDGAGNACDDDLDGDAISNAVDNCVAEPNPLQEDLDGDGLGDDCDDDIDGDAVTNTADNCATTANALQEDLDGDAIGDACDLDDDGDAVDDAIDNCALAPNADQLDTDSDGQGDACDTDDDADGIADASDNCAVVSNVDQLDTDGDGQGDVCDADDDADGIADASDNCAVVSNADQLDTDADGQGDACDADDDADGIADAGDNCPLVINPDQADQDGDSTGDACDGELDGDGVANAADNCPLVGNPGQTDQDGDGLGDACDDDLDGDGVGNSDDNCAMAVNPSQNDHDGDGLGDACDADDDNDGVNDPADNCPLVANSGQSDQDGDGLGDACDPDADGDDVADSGDVCLNTPPGDVVDPGTGCSIAQLCPCSGPRGTSVAWRNHGGYVSCVANSAGSFVEQGLISSGSKDAIVSAAAQSSCGAK